MKIINLHNDDWGRVRFLLKKAGYDVTSQVVESSDNNDYTLNEFMGEGLSAETGTKEEDVDPQELEWGIEIEMEHTNNPEVSKKISIDHLSEFPKYYTNLRRMEEDMKSNKEEQR